jgi:hypothetical protein
MATTEAVAALTAAFERIAATRMAGLPMNNPALKVAAVGFQRMGRIPRRRSDHPMGDQPGRAVVTSSRDCVSAADRLCSRDFPSGTYEFMGGEEPECGAYQFCSLFSPAFEFRDQESAVEVAAAVVAALHAEDEPDSAAGREAARLAGRPASRIPTTRRGFLQGVFGGLKG